MSAQHHGDEKFKDQFLREMMGMQARAYPHGRMGADDDGAMTYAIAADPKRGVVDADCRVHGMSNLFVAGSSLFPTGSTVNPTLTLVALALRLSDHLKRRFAQSAAIE